jgi:hypothetical protein
MNRKTEYRKIKTKEKGNIFPLESDLSELMKRSRTVIYNGNIKRERE